MSKARLHWFLIQILDQRFQMLRFLILQSRMLYVFTIALVSLAVAGCNRSILESSTSKTSNVVRLASLETQIRQDSSDNEELEVAYEVRCGIPTYNRTGAFVVQIVPDGVWVEKGEFLIEFDSFNFESELSECRLKLFQAEAELKQAGSELHIAKSAIGPQKDKMKAQINQLQLEISKQEDEVRSAETMLDMFEPSKKELDAAHESMVEFTKESNKKLATLISNVRQAEDRLTAEKSPNEQEEVANIELSKARRELEDFESEFNSETKRLKRMVDFWSDELTQRNQSKYPTNQFRSKLELAVRTANENLNMARMNLGGYESDYRIKCIELEENIKVTEARFESSTAKTQVLSDRMKKLQAIIEQHKVRALQSGQVRYIEDIELDAGVECRNGQVLMLMMRHPLSENDKTDRVGDGGDRAGGGSLSTMIDRTMSRYDTNGDGAIDQDETGALPEQVRSTIEAADGNGDGSVSKSELTSALEKRMRGLRGGAGGRRDGGDGAGGI